MRREASLRQGMTTLIGWRQSLRGSGHAVTGTGTECSDCVGHAVTDEYVGGTRCDGHDSTKKTKHQISRILWH